MYDSEKMREMHTVFPEEHRAREHGDEDAADGPDVDSSRVLDALQVRLRRVEEHGASVDRHRRVLHSRESHVQNLHSYNQIVAVLYLSVFIQSECSCIVLVCIHSTVFFFSCSQYFTTHLDMIYTFDKLT